MVAHELRNPLNPIRTAAELLHRARPGDDILLVRLQAIIKRQVDHMSRLVEDLLDGSRVSAGKFRLERGSVELEEALRQAVESCREAFVKKEQRLILRVPEGGHAVHGDPVRLAQIFCNLLENASKYTQAQGEIVLTMDVQPGAAKVSIADNGIGISAEALPHIFDLFVQDTRALAVHSGGLGIGLAVVRELVEAHGGSVVASSAGTNLGSHFVVTLPTNDA
jgi:signal transduction histidine kinase